ncbi:MAG: ATP-dependent RNA helicase HrpA [Phycisphaeraceae bacterium]|nr:MAG: ATP-dependent RNA helicase HrpA [Phycisphaeraceae bacterium]
MHERLRQLARDLHGCLVTDRFRIARRLRELQSLAPQPAGPAAEAPGPAREVRDLAREIARCRELARQRAARLPVPTYPEDLPVSQRRAEIAEAIRANQVVVVCGETGSGKTTQLPKICIDAGRGRTGLIGHTQPRRVAARSVAQRIADELGTPLGETVGYKVRFGDKTSPRTMIKVMTDGILLTETQHDRPLAHYDTLIIDEAHERSLNIDFLLGYLRHLLPRRPDLKVVITSATIDPARFSDHFFKCPVIEVSGRTYPVEVRYRPLAAQSSDDDDLRLEEGVRHAVRELSAEGGGDILVFLPGEREIRLAAEDLAQNTPPGTQILPLYARLSASEQQRVFEPHPPSVRRIILATNVAETSLTVPGVRSVIDSGLARMSRYSTGTKVQRLPVEAISRASADQRSGRCGRLGPGVTIRLYAQDDYLTRDRFTTPEILRSNLASVILQMTALRLGRPDDFPFIDPPEGRMIRDGYDTLRELGAIDHDLKITPLGVRLAKLPIDPRLGRMILAAHDENCLSEVLVIASALASDDPRERPADLAEKADAAHEPFDDPESDFIALLNLWRTAKDLEATLSSGKLRKWCRQNFVSYLKLREWSSTHDQLSRLAAQLSLRANQSPAHRDNIHRALLAGLLTNIGRKNDGSHGVKPEGAADGAAGGGGAGGGGGGGYLGCRGIRFHIFPGSALFRKGPAYVMAAELVQTSRLYARDVARIDPVWVETVGAHLVKRQYSEPAWDQDAGAVFAYEKVTLFGLEVVSKRRVHYGPIDPPAAREIFIQSALVERAYASPAPFWSHNAALLDSLQRKADKARRADLAPDLGLVFAFYARRLPPTVFNTVTLDLWRKETERKNPRVLFMAEGDLTPPDAPKVSPDQYPDAMETFGTRLRIAYRFDTAKPDDGLTLDVPLESLHQVDPARCEWLVPGLVGEKVRAILESLPKTVRQSLGPPATLAEQVARGMPFGEGDFLESVRAALRRAAGVDVPRTALAGANLPLHLRMNYRVTDAKGQTLAESRDLDHLRRTLGERARGAFVKAASTTLARDRITDWDFDSLPDRVDLKRGGTTLAAYPAIQDQGASVSIIVLESPAEAAGVTRLGVRRLFILSARDEIDFAIRTLPGRDRLAMLYAPLGSPADLREELAAIIAERAFMSGLPTPRSRDAFVRALRERWDAVRPTAMSTAPVLDQVLALHHQLQLRLSQKLPPAWGESVRDIRLHALLLVHKGSLSSTPWEHVAQMPRYLAASLHRLGKLQTGGVERDARAMGEMADLWREYLTRVDAANRSGRPDGGLSPFKWMLEELRVSLFAQELGTAYPVSPKRVRAALEAGGGRA